jgi:hypothetical protein
VQERLEDNFDTAGAVVELLSLVKDVHFYIDECKSVCASYPWTVPFQIFALFILLLIFLQTKWVESST